MSASVPELYDVGLILEARRMTLEGFNVRKCGYLIQCLEHRRETHSQVYLNRLIKATDKNGKNYLYGNLSDFYDEAKARNTVLRNGYDGPVSNDLIAIAKRQQKLLRKGDNDG